MQTREELIDAYTSLQELQHPNILEILGFATDGLHHDGVLMPLMPLTLEKMLTRGAQRSEAFGHKLRALFPTMIKETVLGLEYLREMHYRMGCTPSEHSFRSEPTGEVDRLWAIEGHGSGSA